MDPLCLLQLQRMDPLKSFVFGSKGRSFGSKGRSFVFGSNESEEDPMDPLLFEVNLRDSRVGP